MKKVFAISLAAALLAGGAAYVFLSSGGSDSTQVTEGAAPVVPAAVPDTQEAEVDTSGIVDMGLGDMDAPVTVVEYASFTCPHCKRFHEGVFEQIKEDYVDTGKVRFIHREVFFDRFGLWAAMVARCGGEMRYFGIADMIYAQQSEWTQGAPVEIAENLKTIGKTAGLTQEQVDACLQDADEAEALLAWYEQNAQADGIQATPSFVIDGRLYSNMSYAEFSDLLDEKIGG